MGASPTSKFDFPKKIRTFSENPDFSNVENFAPTWSSIKFLDTMKSYSARSVDSRGFFCKFMMVGYPYRVPDLEENHKNPHVFDGNDAHPVVSQVGTKVLEV